MAYIYSLQENKETIYVGRTGDIRDRLNSHRSTKFKGRDISLTILEECSDDDERAREYYWMKHYLDKGAKLENKGKYGKYATKNKFYIKNPLLPLKLKQRSTLRN